jgi:hypothetical protein
MIHDLRSGWKTYKPNMQYMTADPHRRLGVAIGNLGIAMLIEFTTQISIRLTVRFEKSALAL